MKQSRRKRTKQRVVKAAAEVDSSSPVRLMTVIAQDPGVRSKKNGPILMATVSIPAEKLEGGPMGYRVHVVDYDATQQRFLGKHELPAKFEDEPRKWKEGSADIVGDNRFRAQNVYALVMKTLARFEFALGRRIGWSFETHQLKVAPQGMADANAFYSPAEEGLIFGYFKGLSGESVYTGLAHDVVVHETTHALLDALRERYLVPSNPDQAAFHEGFADVVALLSVFSQPEVVRFMLRPARADAAQSLISRAECTPEALRDSALFELAEQMGQEIEGIRGQALRKSLVLEPKRDILDQPEFLEAHRRGEVFVAAVMRGFVDAWSARIFKLGTTTQRKFPLERVIEEGADIADALLTLWIRAIDYMPPVDLTFADALTAALTSDTQVRPNDIRYELRRHMKTSFASYGIPAVRTSESDCWNRAPSDLNYDRVRFDSMRSDKDEVFRFIWDNREKLGVRSDCYAKVLSVRPCLRTGLDGFVLRETVVEYYQVARLTPEELVSLKIVAPSEYLAEIRNAKAAALNKRKLASAQVEPMENSERSDDNPDNTDEDDKFLTPLYGGGVLIFDEYGHLKYHIHNKVFGSQQATRLEYLWSVGQLRVKSESSSYRAARLSTLHRLRAIDARRWPSEGW